MYCAVLYIMQIEVSIQYILCQLFPDMRFRTLHSLNLQKMGDYYNVKIISPVVQKRFYSSSERNKIVHSSTQLGKKIQAFNQHFGSGRFLTG
jgi:hypothetical protein